VTTLLKPATRRAETAWLAIAVAALCLVTWHLFGMYRAVNRYTRSLDAMREAPAWRYEPSEIVSEDIYDFDIDGAASGKGGLLIFAAGFDCPACDDGVRQLLERLPRGLTVSRWLVPVGGEAACLTCEAARGQGFRIARPKNSEAFPIFAGITMLPSAVIFDGDGRVLAGLRGVPPVETVDEFARALSASAHGSVKPQFFSGPPAHAFGAGR